MAPQPTPHGRHPWYTLHIGGIDRVAVGTANPYIMNYICIRDEFELEFSGSSRAMDEGSEPSRGTSIFELNTYFKNFHM